MISEHEVSSYFTTGGSLPFDAPSYVERRSDQELGHALRRGEFCYILDARQVGKTSLLVRTLANLHADGINAILLDLNQIGKNLSPEQWYAGLLHTLSRQLRLHREAETYWNELSHLGPSQRWFDTLQAVILPKLTSPLIIFFDEIDGVRSLDFSTDEFFAGIREVFLRRQREPIWNIVTFCLSGAATPSQLINDVRTTPFNIGQRIFLSDFTREEVQPLTKGLVDIAGSPHAAQALLDRVLYWTAGHPFLTQRLCRQVATERGRLPKDVDRCCQALFFSPEAHTTDDNLVFVRNRILLEDEDRAGILSLYTQLQSRQGVLYERTDSRSNHLLMSGIATVRGGRLTVRNRIYATVFDRRWIRENMPGEELRRQRKALYRGIQRASLVWLAFGGVIAYGYFQNRNALEAILRETQVRTQLSTTRHSLTEAQDNLKNLNSLISTKRSEQAKALKNLQLAQGKLTRTTKDRVEAIAQVKKYQKSLQRIENDLRASQKNLLKWQQAITTATRQASEAKVLAREAARVARSQYGTLAATLSHVRGRENDALNYSLKEIQLAERAGLPIDAEQLQHLADAVNNGVFRRYILKENFVLHQAAFSRDGRFLVTAGKNPLATVWDVVSKKEIDHLELFAPDVLSRYPDGIEFSADGKWLLTTALPSTVRVWNVDENKKSHPITLWKELNTKEVGGNLPVLAAAISPHGRMAIIASRGNTADIWNLATGEHHPLNGKHEAPLMAVAFSMRETLVATAGMDGIVKIWDYKRNILVDQHDFNDALGNGRIKADGSPAKGPIPITSVSFSRDLVLCSRSDGATFTWQLNLNKTLESGKIHVFRRHQDWTSNFASSPDTLYRGHELAATASRDGTVGIWNMHWPGKRPLFTIDTHSQWVTDVRFSWDGRRLVTASWDKTAQLWDVPQTMIFNVGGVMKYAEFSPLGNTIVTSGGDGSAILHDFKSDMVGPCFNDSGVNHTTMTKDGKFLITADDIGRIRVWNAEFSLYGTSKQIFELETKHVGPINDVRLSKDNKRLYSVGDDKRVRIWDFEKQKLLREIELPEAGLSVEPSIDGRYLAVSCMNGMVKVFDLVSQARPIELKSKRFYPHEATFSPDGRWIVSADRDSNVHLWDARTGVQQAQLEGHVRAVRSVAFASDGKVFASAGEDGVVLLWNLAQILMDGEKVKPFLRIRAHEDAINSVRFSPDGNYLVTASADGTVRPFPATLTSYRKRAEELQQLPMERTWKKSASLIKMVEE